MGIKTKLAKGPNPLSMRKKQVADKDEVPRIISPGAISKKKRPRKGKRSKELSALKKAGVVT